MQRRDAVNQFRTDPSVRVALLSITAAAVGLDFSTAQVGFAWQAVFNRRHALMGPDFSTAHVGFGLAGCSPTSIMGRLL